MLHATFETVGHPQKLLLKSCLFLTTGCAYREYLHDNACIPSELFNSR